jgi:hypothetical protein
VGKTSPAGTGQQAQACARGVVRVATAGAVAQTMAASRTLRPGKVGLESTSEARPTRLARCEAVMLTKTMTRRGAVEGR